MTIRIVTDHALLRYLERVEGFDTSTAKANLPPYAGDRDVLEWLRDYAGLNIEAKRKAIVTPKLLAAIAAGAKSVGIGPARYMIRGPVVATVKVMDWRAMRPVHKRGTARARVLDRPNSRRLSVHEAEDLMEMAE